MQLPEATPEPNHKVVSDLSEKIKTHLRSQQDVVYATIGGAAAALVGAFLWALITVTIEYQIGYMAIGVGFLVGYAVRYYGAGVDWYFGFIGAFFALVGCALGNLFSQVGFIAESESLGYFETITLLDFPTIVNIYSDSFSPMDVLFYGIAAYEGYKFAFRQVSDELSDAIAKGRLEPLPYANLRLPTVIALFLLLSGAVFLVSKGSVGVKTFNYESGAKRSTGELVHGKENGPWEYWWENGNLQYRGFFVDGKQDSAWEFYDEDGKLYRKAAFKNDLEHGTWSDYYATGQMSNTGNYAFGRLHGPWTYFYENGQVSQKGFYHYDLQDGTWEVYHDNGKLSSKGSYKRSVPTGKWTLWNSQGEVIQEIDYTEDGVFKIMNSWSKQGVAEVVNGNGVYRLLDDEGKVRETGLVRNGNKTGVWKKYLADGKPEEEGEYRDGSYFLINAWSSDGTQTVANREGQYENFSDGDSTLILTGLITKGLKSGKWTITNSVDGTVIQESNYINGKMEGLIKNYFVDGKIYIEGDSKNDKREGKWTWYFENGQLETSVTFVDGKKEGEQPFYNDSGELTRTEVYKNGEFITADVESGF